jgi:cell division protein FtsQ
MRLRTPSPPPDLAPRRTTGAEPAVEGLGRRRRRATWRTRLVRGGIAVSVAGVLGLAAWVVGYSDLLTAQQVTVDGVQPPLAEQVVEVAAVPMGRPLARVDTDAVAERVQTLAAVASASASRSWPSTVVLTVTPRVPVATLFSDDGWYSVDAEGVLFDPADAPADDLPVLAAPDTEVGLDARAAGVSVAQVLPSEVRSQVARIEAPSPVEVRLVLRDDRVVVWGSADDAARKAEVLDVLLQTPATQYDVSVPDRPTLRPA